MPLNTVDTTNLIAGAIKYAVHFHECKALEEISSEKTYESLWKKLKLNLKEQNINMLDKMQEVMNDRDKRIDDADFNEVQKECWKN